MSHKPITPQKVRAILLKAGLRASKGWRSGMVRGWINYTSGFWVRKAHDGAILVGYRHESNRDAAERGLARCMEALKEHSPEHAKDMDAITIYSIT